MKKFLLYGYGGAYNHGTEAIVRTTQFPSYGSMAGRFCCPPIFRNRTENSA